MLDKTRKDTPKYLSLLIAILIILFSFIYFDAFVYDVLAYHVPFSALRINLTDSSYLILESELLERFKGFPSLWQYLLAPGLVLSAPRLMFIPNLLALSIFSCVTKRFFRIPWFVSIPSIFVFPIVLYGFRSAYQDFFVGIILLAGVLVIAASINNLCNSNYSYVGAFLIFTASQVKYQGIISSYLTILAFILIICVKFRHSIKNILRQILPIVLSLILISIHPLNNFISHGNPVYPIKLGFFDGPESNYTSSPIYTKSLGFLSVPINHISSATEIDWLLRGVDVKYSIDSGHSQVQKGGLLDNRSFSGSGVDTDTGIVRTGGTFGLAYTIYLGLFIITLAACVIENRNTKSLPTKSALDKNNLIIDLLLVYLINLFSPQSHELRYYIILLLIPVFVVNYYAWFSSYRKASIYLTCFCAMISFVINFSQPLKTSIQTFFESGSVEYATNYPVRDFPDQGTCSISVSQLPIDQSTACWLLRRR